MLKKWLNPDIVFSLMYFKVTVISVKVKKYFVIG